MPGLLTDVYGNVKIESAYASSVLTDGTEGTIVDVSGNNGTIMATIDIVEAASTPVDDKLDITVHNVSSDSDAADTDNLVTTFTQIVGANGDLLAHHEVLPINLNDLPIMTDAEKVTAKANGYKPVKPYLQILITNTHAWAASPLIAKFVCAGARSLPTQAL